ncbi:MAG: hypothetical protein WA951_11550 [Leeuwenhoekiella sp.]
MNKNLLFSGIICAVLLLLSGCAKEDEDILTRRTVIQGKVFDSSRNLNKNGDTLIFEQTMDCSPQGVCGYLISKVLDTLITDANGEYYGEYDLVDGECILRPQVGVGFSSLGGAVNEMDSIKLGQVNVIDFDIFSPIILELKLRVSNNKNAPLHVRNEMNEPFHITFRSEQILEENTEQIIYLKTRPNTDIEIYFYYTTGSTNQDFHEKLESFRTSLQDTISLSYSIDCSTF